MHNNLPNDIYCIPDEQIIKKKSNSLKVVSDFKPSGDQPQAISELVEGIRSGEKDQVLLGVTGSGKTYTIANTIELVNRPALILAPNKTLAAQLYGEMKDFFPNNAVEYFVSYYDYYQPEAYVPRTDTYIEKDASINEQIDRMRHSATRALLEQNDVIIVSSVSCIYGIGSVETYSEMTEKISDEHTELLKSRISLNKFGNPEDVANTIAFLSSNLSDYITGETIHVNGGMYFS